ncbi:MAG TPA: SDR family NAD(P)-dependent oxidoreductase [Micromonosporaceae bacterium]|nr:SDR family NAD(P)-dependent oxidoreductase [Micromonosporaceae bacterium]
MTGTQEPIAIIGLAGRFPGADDTDQLWSLLHRGAEGIAFPSDEELLAAGVPATALADPAYVKAVAAARDVDGFDAELFGLTPREAQVCDPQIRMFLECAHAALENAGYAPGRTGDVGVFGAAGTNRYLQLLAPAGPAGLRSTSGMSLTSWNNTDYVSLLASYKLGLRGPSLTVQTACSSSLVAVHLAVQALRSGECELALAGGVDVELPLGHGHWWEPGGPLSRDGHCRPFDAAATGTVFGSGVGLVVLKRLRDALADGDWVHAVIRSTAVNNDGSGKVGFTAPSVAGQATVIAEAIALAGVGAEDIGLVEAHGTATVLGDPVEVAALGAAFRRMAGTALAPASCALASVKGNVGHLGHAAGVTSLVKVVLALSREAVPANANFTEANPKLQLDGSPFHIPTATQPWPRTPGRPRLAGVSALGMGGTNVHAIVEEAPAVDRVARPHRPRVVVWSAASAPAEEAYRERLGAHFARAGAAAFADSVATLQHGRSLHRVRGAVVAAGAAEAAAALADPRSAAVVPPALREGPRGVAFLFPGQGSQHAGVAFDLYAHVPAFATALDECLDLFDAEGLPLRQAWRDGTRDEDLQPTAVAQPLHFAVGYALAAAWRAWGVTPAALLGHSVGELVAATVAEVLTLAGAVRAVSARARAMQEMPAGGMLALAGSVDAVTPLLVDGVSVAVDNGARQVVVAGPAKALDQVQLLAREHRLPCRPVRTSHAFHSPMMAGAVAPFEAALRAVELRRPRTPLYSAATGRMVTAAEAGDPAFWSRQLVEPVRFGPALDALLADADRLLVEAGPGRTLTALARQHPGVAGGRHRAVATLPQRRTEPPGDRHSVLTAVATVWVEGHPVDWAALDWDPTGPDGTGADGTGAGGPVRRVPLPGYPYQRQRHWAQAPAPDAPAPARDPDEGSTSPFSLVSWVESPRPPATAAADGLTALALLPADRTVARQLTAQLRRAGLRVVAVRPGEAYADGGGSFVVRPGEPDDLGAVLAALAARDDHPGLLVHAQTVGAGDPLSTANPLSTADPAASVDDQLRLGFHTACTLVRLAGRAAPPGRRPGLLVLTQGAVDVGGAEPVRPGNAALPALVRTLPGEEPRVTAKLVDLGAGVDEQDLVDEVRAWDRNEVVALRGDRRWVPTERPYAPAPGDGPGLRRGGVYLLTGGLGGLGGAVARALAGTGLRPRLVLLSRGGRAEPGLVDELGVLGAQVRTAACDVADAAALGDLVDRVTAASGPVNGVLHLAGQAGGGLVGFSTEERAGEVFAGKVGGLLAVAEVFADRPPLDFLVAFSSRSAIEGEAGGAAYAAANAVLDALVRAGRVNAGRLLSVGWSGWREVGMAAATFAAADPAGAADPGGVDPDGGLNGIPPALGGRLLLDLLGARTPRQVAVRHFRGGRPVPLAAPGAAAPAAAAPAMPVAAPPAAGTPPPAATAATSATAATDATAATSATAAIRATAATGGAAAASVADRLSSLWTQSLGIRDIAPDADFFELGGNSLTTVELMSRIRESFGITLEIGSIFDFPTLRTLAGELERLGAR